MNTTYSFEVIEAIAYSRLENQTFTVGECIVLHQWHNGFSTPGIDLMNKYKTVRKQIEKTKWVKPEMKYMEGGDLYKQCPYLLTWKKIINN
ncbi:MAG TPA: hypothetical protein DHV22_16930 [Xanthomarina gelatinilytica]|uniref:Uncharacterized protein n=1 Tax=Xanthomarina gelatinilytica TaxID=1137281 RepID=A0A3D6BYA0_9FLAO|nr:hypothetical protein [Xanthomarina gelatinilytica]